MSKHIQEEEQSTRLGEPAVEPSKLGAAAFAAIVAIPMVCTVIYGAVDPWALGLQVLLGGVLLALWTADSFSSGQFRISTSALQLPLLGLILVGLAQLLPFGSADGGANLPQGLSSAVSFDPFATRFAVIQLLSYLIFLSAALTFIDSPKRLKVAVTSMLVFTSFMAFFGVLQYLAKPEAIYGLRPTPQAEPFSAYVNKHHFAALMEMTFGVALSMLIGKSTQPDKRFLLAIVLVMSGIACVLTGSRGGLLSLAAVVFFVLIAHFLLARKHRDSEGDGHGLGNIFSRTFSMLFVVLAVTVVLVGSVLLLGGDSSLIRGIGFSGQEDASSGRLHFWSVAWRVFASHPLMGVGLDSFGVAFTKYDTWQGIFRIEQAHNEYLQVLAEAGLLGFACLVGFIVLLFRKSVQRISEMTDNFPRGVAVGALAGIFGVLLHSCFDFPLRTPANGYFFALLAAFATASIRFPRSKHHRRHRRQHAAD